MVQLCQAEHDSETKWSTTGVQLSALLAVQENVFSISKWCNMQQNTRRYHGHLSISIKDATAPSPILEFLIENLVLNYYS